jgi:hypothetical protein
MPTLPTARGLFNADLQYAKQPAPAVVPFWDTAPGVIFDLVGDPSTYSSQTGLYATQGGFQAPPTEWDVVRYGSGLTPLPGLAVVMHVGRKARIDNKKLPGTDYATPTILGLDPLVFEFELLLWSVEQLNAMTETVMPVIFPGKGQPIIGTKTITTTTPYNLSSQQGYSQGAAVTGDFVSAPGQNLAAPYFLSNGIAAGETPAPQVVPANVGTLTLPVRLQHPSLLFHGVRAVIFQEVHGPRQWRSHNDIYALTCKTIEWRPSRAAKTVTPNQQTSPPSTAFANQPAANSPASTQPSANGGANPGESF